MLRGEWTISWVIWAVVLAATGSCGPNGDSPKPSLHDGGLSEGATTVYAEPTGAMLPDQLSTLGNCAEASDGYHCADGQSFECSQGTVVGFTRCPTGTCANESDCISPGSGIVVGSDKEQASPEIPSCGFDASNCGTCLNRYCCSKVSRCNADPGCGALWNCLSTCGDIACFNGCAKQFPSGLAAARALLTCSRESCLRRCGDTDPCVLFPGTGYACAEKLGLRDGSSNPRRLYFCSANVTVGSVICKDGCSVAPEGMPDHCQDPDPCANTAYTRRFCGANLTPLASESTLYTCHQQATVDSVVCPNGCNASAPGNPDFCR
jgi:hypothetical protein